MSTSVIDPLDSPRLHDLRIELTAGKAGAIDALAAFALEDDTAALPLRRAAAGAALIAEHLAAEGYVHRDRLAAVLRGMPIAAQPSTAGDTLGLCAAALLETYGEWDDASALRSIIESLLAAEQALLPADLAPDVVLLGCCALGEWCERNGLEAAFERVAVAATLAQTRAELPWLATHWRVVAAWHWNSLGREGDARAALAQAETIARQSGLEHAQTVVALQRARLIESHAAPDDALALARRLRETADPQRTPLWLADAADIECRAALTRLDYRAAVVHARQALAWLHAARAPAGYRLTYALREVYALTGLGAVAETASRIAAIEAVDPPAFLAARIRVVTGLLSLARCDREGRWSEHESSQLATLLARLRELEWPSVLRVLPHDMARLFARGLAAGIEVRWLHSAIRARRLDPPSDGPCAYPVQWPWPVRLRLLGRFECHADGSAAPEAGKAAAKPLALLRRIALHEADGGVSAAALAQALWPGEGREGRDKALETTLARLRRHLGCADAVLLHEQRLRLNPARVWCDWPALLRLLDRIERAPREDFGRGWADAFELWRGPLLADSDDAAWLGPWRDRLRARLAAALLSGFDTPGHVARCLRAISIDAALESWLLRADAAPARA